MVFSWGGGPRKETPIWFQLAFASITSQIIRTHQIFEFILSHVKPARSLCILSLPPIAPRKPNPKKRSLKDTTPLKDPSKHLHGTRLSPIERSPRLPLFRGYPPKRNNTIHKNSGLPLGLLFKPPPPKKRKRRRHPNPLLVVLFGHSEAHIFSRRATEWYPPSAP